MRESMIVIRGLLITALLFPMGLGAQQTGPSCDVPEVLHPEGGVDYSRLVCAGVDALEAGDARKAAVFLDSASSKLLYDYPNFAVLPRLAVAQWRAGNKERAERALEIGRVALSVVTGIYTCEQVPTGFRLRTGRDSVAPPVAEAVIRRMCGAAYEYVYEPSTLEAARREGQLIELFFRVRAEISGT